MTDSPALIFIIDDEDSVRTSLERLLRSAGYQVETFPSAEAFLDRPAHDGNGCTILDVQMPGLTGMDLQARLAGRSQRLPLIFLTGHGDIPMSVQAMKEGAADFLTKPIDEAVLLAAVRQALDEHTTQLVERREVEAIRLRVSSLSPRELQVLRCLLTGALNKEVGAHLGIVEKTVKVHRARVLEKMGVQSIAELVRLAAFVGIEPDPMEHRP